MFYTLLEKDGITEIVHDQARSQREALMVFGKHPKIKRQLELCEDPAEAEFYLRSLDDTGRHFICDPVRWS